uniref:Uncharacterized protein n=1 Tax=Romanomermis culicivorax TaxID=13658 RepID=A0A915J7D6_ROMCU
MLTSDFWATEYLRTLSRQSTSGDISNSGDENSSSKDGIKRLIKARLTSAIMRRKSCQDESLFYRPLLENPMCEKKFDQDGGQERTKEKFTEFSIIFYQLWKEEASRFLENLINSPFADVEIDNLIDEILSSFDLDFLKKVSFDELNLTDADCQQLDYLIDFGYI